MDKINYPQLTKLNLFYNLVNKLVNLTSWLPNLFWDQGVKKNFMSKNLQRAASILSAVALISWLLIPSSSYIFAEGQCRAGQYNFTKTLYKGMKDPQVKDLQEMLAYCESSDIYPEKVVSGYYGSLTEAAVKRFQKKYGISPVGTFGPVTRAKANSLYGQGAQAQQPQTGATSQNQLLQQLLQQLASQNPALAALLQAFLQTQAGQQPQTPAAPTGQVSVSLSPNSPMSGSLIAGSAQVPVLVFTISNGTSGDVTLTGLTFKKVGVVSDINITNGYLAEGNNILSQFSSFSNGVMTFSGNLLTIPAGQSKEVALRLDISTGATTGQTVSFQLTNVQVSGGQVSANLPLNGGTFTVTQVNNPSLAQISGFDYSGVTSEVDAGTEGVRIFAANMNVTNSPVKLMSIRFSITGSINPATDLANLVLRIDGQNAGSVSAPDASGKVYVDLGQGFQMGTGNHTLELYADVLGTPNRKFKVEILRPYDVVALDTQYNTYIPVGTPGPTPATEITVRQGQVVMNLASDSPTGNIAKGQSNVVLLKFKIRAAGEAVRIKWLPFKLEKLGGTAWNSGNIDNYIRNVALYDDAGNQVGSTISQLGVSGACGGVGATINANDLTCSFGSPSSHINYLLPANTTRTFTLRVDVQTNFDGSGLKGSIVAPSGGFGGNNIEGQISFQGSTSQTIQGAMLTISQTPFVGSPNTSVGTQTYVRGKSNAKIASFSLSASSAEGIEVSSLTFNVNDSTSGSGANLKLQNLYVKVGNNQWGNIVSTVSTANTNYSFSGVTPFTIPAGGSVIVDVYADILQTSATGTYSSVVDLTSASAVGVVSRASQSLSGTVNGQSVVVTGSGAFSSVSVDPSNPPSKQVVLGSTNQTLANFRFTADNNEDIRITDMDVEIVAVDTSTAPATFRNVRLLDGSSVVGWGTALSGPVATTSPGLGNSSTADSVFTSSFHFATPLVVPKNQTKTYTLAADVASYTESTNSHNVQYAARLASVTAVGNDSNESVPSATTTFASIQTTLRTKLEIVSFVATKQGSVRRTNDEVGLLTLSVDPAYDAVLKRINLVFSGQPVSNAFNTATTATDTASFDVKFIDESGNILASTSTLVETGPNTGAFMAQLVFSPLREIQAGKQDKLRLIINSSGFSGSSNNNPVSLSISIDTKDDLVWSEKGGSVDLVLEPGVPGPRTTISVNYQ
jgi:hypothetical protein